MASHNYWPMWWHLNSLSTLCCWNFHVCGWGWGNNQRSTLDVVDVWVEMLKKFFVSVEGIVVLRNFLIKMVLSNLSEYFAICRQKLASWLLVVMVCLNFACVAFFLVHALMRYESDLFLKGWRGFCCIGAFNQEKEWMLQLVRDGFHSLEVLVVDVAP